MGLARQPQTHGPTQNRNAARPQPSVASGQTPFFLQVFILSVAQGLRYQQVAGTKDQQCSGSNLTDSKQ